MKYCPKCKTEYKDSALMCGDCKVELVGSLEEAKQYKNLLKLKQDEVEKVKEYLDYSGVKQYKFEEDGDSVVLSVVEDEYEKAYKYMTVYVSENMTSESNEDDYFFDEYKTEDVGSDSEVSDLKGTVYSFGIMGVIFVIFSGFSLLNVVKTPISDNKMMIGMILIFGVVSLYVAYNTNKKATELKKVVEEKQDKLENLIKEFDEKFDLSNYLEHKKVDLEGEDDGVKYFIIFDMIKGDLKSIYPDESEGTINSVAEKVYEMLTNE